jgi:predicted nucleic acid-binding protein
MSDRFFLDTNVFVYSFDNSAVRKRDRARALIAEALSSGAGLVSYQVVQEFSNVATRTFATPMNAVNLSRYLTEVLLPLCEVMPDSQLFLDAVGLHARTGFSYYDSLIVQAALRSGCSVLYTENLQNGFSLSGLTIQNPFVQ